MICKLRPEAAVVEEVVEEPPDDVDDLLGVEDVLDCEVSVTNAIVATARTMITTTTNKVIPMPRRGCLIPTRWLRT